MRLVLAAALAGALLPSAAASQAPEAAPGVPAQAAAPRFSSLLVPDTVLAPAGGPTIVVLASPGVGLAALRLAVPLSEGEEEAGAGRLLRALAIERMRTLARPVGAEVSAARTPWGLAYSVVGAAADFEYLAYLLREAVAPPDVEAPTLAEARLRLLGEAEAAVETPAGRLAADLRSQVAPGLPPLEGTPESVAALDADAIRTVWRRSHRASAMTLVVSAPVVPEVVLAATRGMGAPEEPAAETPRAPRARAARPGAPQTLRTWYGEAWVVGGSGDPLALVLAELVAERLRSGGGGIETSVELWDLPGRSVLAIVGAAYSRELTAMRRAVSGALASTRESLDEPTVSAAVARARRDLMMATRTPAGLVAVVGRAMESGGDPLAAARGADALLAVDARALRETVDRLVRAGARSAEVRP